MYVSRNDKIPSFGLTPGKNFIGSLQKVGNNLQMSIYKLPLECFIDSAEPEPFSKFFLHKAVFLSHVSK